MMIVSNPYDMRLSVETSTEMPLLLTDLVKVVRLGAVTPVAAGMLISRPTVQQVLAEKSKKRCSIASTLQDKDGPLPGGFFIRDPQLP